MAFVPDPSSLPTFTEKWRRSITGVSARIIAEMMPLSPPGTRFDWARFLSEAMLESEIITVARGAAFLAQLAHESGELRFLEEIASGKAYEGRRDLGNVHGGDGPRYKGRGPIQLTGRANYSAASAALGVDLVSYPQLAATPQLGARVAGWYWLTRGLNSLADAGDFVEITRRVNGGFRGWNARLDYFRKALRAYGALDDTPPIGGKQA